MKFGTESNNELTQKYKKVKVQMTYVRPHIYTSGVLELASEP